MACAPQYAPPVSRWSFRRKPKQEHFLGEYTEPSFRGALTMLILSLAVIVALWLAYSWALSQRGVDDPNGRLDRAVPALAVSATR
jgi:hypothetical protein